MTWRQCSAPTVPYESAHYPQPAIGALRREVAMIVSACRPNIYQEFCELSQCNVQKHATFELVEGVLVPQPMLDPVTGGGLRQTLKKRANSNWGKAFWYRSRCSVL